VPKDLLGDIRKLIEETRSAVARTVNAGLAMLYWRIGKRIGEEILKGHRAEYGKQIVVSLSRQLVQEHGNSFSEKNLRRMVQFAEVFPDEQIVVSLIRHLSWTHFLALIPLRDPLQREFYAAMCRAEGWSSRSCTTCSITHRASYRASCCANTQILLPPTTGNGDPAFLHQVYIFSMLIMKVEFAE